MTSTKTFAATATSTTPCTLNPNTFHGQAAFQYILNSDFFDTQRSKPAEGFYVVDWNRIGIMSQKQEYAVYRFMMDEFGELVDLEYEDIHSKALYFKVDGCLLSVGIYDLEQDEIVPDVNYLWDMDEVDDLDFGCFKNVLLR